jgi:hypothetical protein
VLDGFADWTAPLRSDRARLIEGKVIEVEK